MHLRDRQFSYVVGRSLGTENDFNVAHAIE
jgi:hypothetical protein